VAGNGAALRALPTTSEIVEALPLFGFRSPGTSKSDGRSFRSDQAGSSFQLEHHRRSLSVKARHPTATDVEHAAEIRFTRKTRENVIVFAFKKETT